MDNGGIMLKDAWGSALVLDGGDIYIQAAKDLTVQPLRNFIAKAGHFVSIGAKKDIDMSSTEGGFRLKTKLNQHLYTKEQGIILQSDTEEDLEPTPEDKAYNKFGGIMLKSTKGIYQFGEKIFDRATEKGLYKSGRLMLESVTDRLGIRAENNIEILSNNQTFMVSKGNITVLTNGALTCVGAGSANFAGDHTNIGNKGVLVGLVPHPGSLPAVLDGVIPVDQFKPITDRYLKLFEDENYQEQMIPFTKDDKFDIKFRFLESKEYKLKKRQDCIPMTIAQQDDLAFGFLKLEAWKEQEVNSTLPFPGKDAFSEYYLTADLVNWKLNENDMASKPSGNLVNSAAVLRPTSLDHYKIYPEN